MPPVGAQEFESEASLHVNIFNIGRMKECLKQDALVKIQPLTRIIHETFTAEAYMGMSTAFRSLGLNRCGASGLDSTVECDSGALGRKPCIHTHLHLLATNLHE